MSFVVVGKMAWSWLLRDWEVIIVERVQYVWSCNFQV